MYEKIPDELKPLNQWVNWRLVQRDPLKKATKIPFCPRGGAASSTNPTTWGTFDEAVAAMQKYSGIGFVLTSADSFVVIDIDATEDEKTFELQQKILDRFKNTYIETSVSGRGLHIIAKGSVPRGTNRAGVEIYSAERFIVMTGNAINGNKIIDCSADIASLYNFILESRQKNKLPPVARKSEPMHLPDWRIIEIASGAANGSKFTDLYRGNWQAFYESQSQADFALVDIIAHYTDNHAQIVRIFRGSSLGQRDKASRDDYMNFMMERAFDNKMPKINIDEMAKIITSAVEKPHGK